MKANAGEDLFRFQCRALKLPPPVEQFEFAASMGRLFRSDFAFTEYQLLVEIQGGIWLKGGGAHSRPLKIAGDIRRQQYAVRLGYFLLPFTPDEVVSGHAIEWTQEVLHHLGWRP